MLYHHGSADFLFLCISVATSGRFFNYLTIAQAGERSYPLIAPIGSVSSANFTIAQAGERSSLIASIGSVLHDVVEIDICSLREALTHGHMPVFGMATFGKITIITV